MQKTLGFLHFRLQNSIESWIEFWQTRLSFVFACHLCAYIVLYASLLVLPSVALLVRSWVAFMRACVRACGEAGAEGQKGEIDISQPFPQKFPFVNKESMVGVI